MRRVAALAGIVMVGGLHSGPAASGGIVRTLSVSATRDTSISQSYPTYTEGATDRLYLYGGGGGNDSRALAGFGSLPSALAGAEVISATLRMELARSFGDTVEVRWMTHDWSEGASGYNPAAGGADWNTYDGTHAWPGGAGALGDAALPMDRKTLPNLGLATSGTFAAFDVTSAARNWGEGSPNYGLLLNVTSDAGYGTSTRFFSREAATGAPPQVVMTLRPADFGRQWVRQNPFTIMGAVSNPLDVGQYMGAGLKQVFAAGSIGAAQSAAAAGVPWQAQIDFDTFTSQFSGLAGCTGVYAYDEPWDRTQMAYAASQVQRYKSAYPEKLVYVNALPSFVFPTGGYASYDEYLDDIIHSVKSDVVMFDRYPFLANGTTDRDGWFSNLMAVRARAMVNNRPYWGWLQSSMAAGSRIPSESDLRFNAWTLLTAGYTGLNYYTYDNTGWFLDANGGSTAFYRNAAAANAEIASVGQSLRMLNSTEVRFIRGTTSSTPPGLSGWTAGAGGDIHLLNVAVDTSNPQNRGADKDGLIGFFTDDDGQRYFMLSNLYHGAALSAPAASLSFTLTFDSGVDSLWLLNRLTGSPQQIALANHVLHWTLPGGTGDLFKYGNGSFAGWAAPSPGWRVDASGDWNVAANWTGGIPNGVGAAANFAAAVTGPTSVYTNSAVTVGSIRFDNAGSYQITGTGSLTIQVASGSGTIQVMRGSHQLNLPIVFASDTSIDVAPSASLTISDPAVINAGRTVSASGNLIIQAPLVILAGGAFQVASGQTTLGNPAALAGDAEIDVMSNALMMDYRGQASPAPMIAAQLAGGYATGRWDGAGINTSAAVPGRTGLGWADDPAGQRVSVRYSFYGDANLDGKVDVVDLGILAASWQAPAVWARGDFDYSGLVDVVDLGMLAANWHAGIVGPDPEHGGLRAALAAFGLPGPSVPEPAIPLLAVTAAASFLTRNRRSQA